MTYLDYLVRCRQLQLALRHVIADCCDGDAPAPVASSAARLRGTQGAAMVSRTRNGVTQVWEVHPLWGGRWVTQRPERQKREKCRVCHDAGQIPTGVVDPDDPWSASTYEPCPRGCKKQ